MRSGSFLLLAVLLAGGCASGSDVERLQAQIFDLQDQVAQLKKSSSTDVQQINQRLQQQTEELLRSSADLTVRVGEIEEKIQNSVGMTEQTSYRLDRLVQQMTQLQREISALQPRPAGDPAPVTEGGTPSAEEVIIDAPGSVASEDPIELYQAAYRDYQRSNFDLARAGFTEYLQKYPATDLSDNAAYWIGETYFAEKKYREAIQNFDRVVNSFSRSDKVPAALLKKGLAYLELGERAQGIVQLQYVVHEHPSSQEASIARQRLQALGIR